MLDFLADLVGEAFGDFVLNVLFARLCRPFKKQGSQAKSGLGLI